MEITYTNFKQIKRLTFVVLLFAISIFACKKGDATADYERPVVEGYLVPGQPITVKVYYQKYLEDTISYGYPIKDLQLKITSGGNTVNLTETEDGVYQYADGTFVKENGTYTLNFICLSKEISATTTIPSKPQNFTASGTEQVVPTFSFGTTPDAFIPIQFNWTNNNLNDYYLISVQCAEAVPIKLATRRPGNNYSVNSESIVGQANTFNTSEENFSYFGGHNVLLFHINKEYYDALTANNSASSLNLTNPTTNVSNGLGIFTGLRADTLQINVSQ